MTQQPPLHQQYPTPSYAAPPVYGALPAPGPGEPFDGASDSGNLLRPLYGASFGQAAKRFLKNYANFKGRASRSEYWWAQLFILLIQWVPALIWIGLYYLTSETVGLPLPFLGQANVFVGLSIPVVIGLACLIPSLAIAWRRLHDANFAGPFWLLSLTSIGSIVVLIFTLLPSKPEGRRFDAQQAPAPPAPPQAFAPQAQMHQQQNPWGQTGHPAPPAATQHQSPGM